MSKGRLAEPVSPRVPLALQLGVRFLDERQEDPCLELHAASDGLADPAVGLGVVARRTQDAVDACFLEVGALGGKLASSSACLAPPQAA